MECVLQLHAVLVVLVVNYDVPNHHVDYMHR
jgi:hypothetical protein